MKKYPNIGNTTIMTRQVPVACHLQFCFLFQKKKKNFDDYATLKLKSKVLVKGNLVYKLILAWFLGFPFIMIKKLNKFAPADPLQQHIF